MKLLTYTVHLLQLLPCFMFYNLRGFFNCFLQGIVGEKVCQFKGFMQQDAQEFMAFLLDGLHEVGIL